jgi:cytochrome c553
MYDMRLLLLFLVACDVLAAPQDFADLPDKVRAAQGRMHKRFEASSRMQHAIALGQLERAQAEAKIIDSLGEPEILPEWRPYIERVRAAAREVTASKDTVAASRASALLGRQCARCHEATTARIVFAKPGAPNTGGKLAPQMVSHDWAAARMWEGLIAPDDERWLTGARRLVDAKVAVTAESGKLGIADDVSRMRLFARRALTTKPQDDRTQLYGDLLATCAHCHYAIRD